MLVLAIETATKNCSVALFNKGVLINSTEENKGYSHAEKLHQFVDQTLKKSEVSFNDLNAIAISSGPGSYTGLRIGLSTAKGLCFALDIPLISIKTLENMAHAARLFISNEGQLNSKLREYFFCPMIDARRMEVYAMLLDNNLTIIEDNAAVIVDSDEKWQQIFHSKNMVYFGDGASKCRPILDKFDNCYFLERQQSFATAAAMGELITKKMNEKDFENTAYFEPDYLKEFQATTPKKIL